MIGESFDSCAVDQPHHHQNAPSIPIFSSASNVDHSFHPTCAAPSSLSSSSSNAAFLSSSSSCTSSLFLSRILYKGFNSTVALYSRRRRPKHCHPILSSSPSSANHLHSQQRLSTVLHTRNSLCENSAATENSHATGTTTTTTSSSSLTPCGVTHNNYQHNLTSDLSSSSPFCCVVTTHSPPSSSCRAAAFGHHNDQSYNYDTNKRKERDESISCFGITQQDVIKEEGAKQKEKEKILTLDDDDDDEEEEEDNGDVMFDDGWLKRRSLRSDRRRLFDDGNEGGSTTTIIRDDDGVYGDGGVVGFCCNRCRRRGKSSRCQAAGDGKCHDVPQLRVGDVKHVRSQGVDEGEEESRLEGAVVAGPTKQQNWNDIVAAGKDMKNGGSVLDVKPPWVQGREELFENGRRRTDGGQKYVSGFWKTEKEVVLSDGLSQPLKDLMMTTERQRHRFQSRFINEDEGKWFMKDDDKKRTTKTRTEESWGVCGADKKTKKESQGLNGMVVVMTTTTAEDGRVGERDSSEEGILREEEIIIRLPWEQQVVVVKRIMKQRFAPLQLTRCCREVEILRRLKHPNIIRLLSFVNTDDELWMVFENAPFGDLYKLTNLQTLSERHTKRILRQILSALVFVHSAGMVHSDIKPHNVLLFPGISQHDVPSMKMRSEKTLVVSLFGTATDASSGGKQRCTNGHTDDDGMMDKDYVGGSDNDEQPATPCLTPTALSDVNDGYINDDINDGGHHNNDVEPRTVIAEKQHGAEMHGRVDGREASKGNDDGAVTVEEIDENEEMIDEILDWDTVRVKICDFGLAQYVNGDGIIPFQGVLGTQNYIAPEVLKNLDYDAKIDVWAVGIIAFQLLVGYEPFFPPSASRTADLVFDPRYWDEISEDAKDFVRRALNRNAASRISAAEALAHPWFQTSAHDEKNVKVCCR